MPTVLTEQLVRLALKQDLLVRKLATARNSLALSDNHPESMLLRALSRTARLQVRELEYQLAKTDAGIALLRRHLGGDIWSRCSTA